MRILFNTFVLFAVIALFGCSGAGTGSGSPTEPDFTNEAAYDLVIEFEIEGISYEINVLDTLEAIREEATALDRYRSAQWTEWSGLPYNGMDGTNMSNLQIIQHLSAQLVGFHFGWGTLYPGSLFTGCDVYNDFLFPQLWAFHEANEFLMYPQFLVWTMERNLYDFKNDWVEEDDAAPCVE